MGRGRGKSDPSRGAGRHVDGPGDRGGLPGCADGGPWPPAPSAAARAGDSRTSRTRARGHTRDRSRRGDRTADRSSDEGAGPRRRRPPDDRRLDVVPKPWHNTNDRLGLSEGEAVTRGLVRALILSSYATRNSRGPATPGAMDAAVPVDANSRAHRDLQNRADRGFAQRPQPSSTPENKNLAKGCYKTADDRPTKTGRPRPGGWPNDQSRLRTPRRLRAATAHRPRRQWASLPGRATLLV